MSDQPDIVERMRGATGLIPNCDDCYEAADEIERLRGAVRVLAECVNVNQHFVLVETSHPHAMEIYNANKACDLNPLAAAAIREAEERNAQ